MSGCESMHDKSCLSDSLHAPSADAEIRQRVSNAFLCGAGIPARPHQVAAGSVQTDNDISMFSLRWTLSTASLAKW
jgi:hypothetical protein